ncbi:MAG: selenide, water dikinase SelD [Dehalococcoidia bacterium]|nr:selenide, water dikinase SelD [Dehalococcoidia bacterium]
MPHASHPELLVGIDTGDDAAVYRLSEDLAIINTVDFFPPIVDDPYEFGAISATNSVSDVYAMGGKPILALNVVCFPEDQPIAVLTKILEGGSSVAREAEMLIAGGHTIKDSEPKYGMAVTGIINPNKLVKNIGAKPGDFLVLTKPIGTGIISTAAKNRNAKPEVLDNAIRVMRILNRMASEVMNSVGVSAATDVTGFGLIGHLTGMMEGSSTTALLQSNAVPVLKGARPLLEQGVAPGGTIANFGAVDARVGWGRNITDQDKLLLCDAQTSGGLLMSVPGDKLDIFKKQLASNNVFNEVIGTVLEAQEFPIIVE